MGPHELPEFIARGRDCLLLLRSDRRETTYCPAEDFGISGNELGRLSVNRAIVAAVCEDGYWFAVGRAEACDEW